MNGGSKAYSRLFLALGSLVVAGGILRALWSLFAVRGVLEKPAAPTLGRFAAAHGGVVAAGIAALAVIVVVSVGALRRRPWALGASIALLGSGAAAGIFVAVLELAALVRGVDHTPDAAEIGYGPVLSYWRMASVLVGLIVAVFCAAALRRFFSEDLRKQFRGSAGTVGRTL